MKWFRRLLPYVILVILVAANATVWVRRQAIADWWRLYNYEVPINISQLADDDTMTDSGKHLFYINRPALEDQQAFNVHCASHSEQTSVLGCYRGDRQGIYVYAVTDERLGGVEQVTAAHEMLHQAYDRLSSGDKQRVDKLITDYAATVTDKSLKDKLDAYRKQGADLTNEMHSIFGTEVRRLPAGLEQYYKRYFTDRGKVVDYYESYRGEFTRREAQVAEYDARLATLKARIDADKKDLDSKLAALKAKEDTLNAEANTTDAATYNKDVDAYNADVRAYNAELTATKRRIAEYNQLVDDRNTIAFQEQQLQEALDSRFSSSPKQQ